ncbi:protein OS-9 isoform X2 [Oenanthe melanoleuca]|uniref:protein OS-9 isoform X2 n=1 Tax=Oenanthe melanoleuca TaxID=2939378 RepID=UPI0024C1BF18|nr:protein OS-9 isoform X2 [Oenanthe melanoleuca]
MASRWPIRAALLVDRQALEPIVARSGAAGAGAGRRGRKRKRRRGAKMAARRGPGPVAVLALLALLGPGRPLRGARAALNLQELSELKYGLEILAEPVLAGQHQAEDVVTVASRFKQRYECRLPPAAVGPPPGPARDPRLYNGSGVAELLRPMGTAPCLLKTKDWWTYEFCYGRHIQQYHLEESEIKGDVLVLGYYQSAFDWDDETAKATKQHQLRRYHSQSYVNGSRCDLTGRAREAEVRFLCEEGAGDYIARVDEPQSCWYVLTVHTTRICHHPFLRPAPGLAPQPIRCQPALSPAQYVQYVRAQVSDTKRKVEEISEELRTLDTRLWSDRDSDPPSQSPQGSQQGNQAEPAKDVTAGEQEVTATASDQQDSTREPSPRAAGARAADPRKKIHFKVIRSPGDLLQFIEELKESTRKAKEKASEEEEAAAKAPPAPPSPAEPPSPETLPGPEAPPAGEEVEEEEDEEEEEEAGPLLAGLELLPREQVARLKEEVKSQMEQEFDSIISEVEDELETEGLKGEFDRSRASRTLASTLSRLMERLDRAEPRRDPPEPPRQPAGAAPAAGGRREEQQEEEEEEEGGAAGKGGRGLPSEGRPRARVGRAGNPPREREPPQGKQEPPQGKQEAPQGQQEPPREKQSPPQLPQVENEVRALLAKEGLRAEGKIEIKIVTASSGGEEEEAAQWLSEEDSRSLKEIFLSILGTEEAQRERRRQQALEDNYRFVWGGRDEPPPPADSEDQDF